MTRTTILYNIVTVQLLAFTEAAIADLNGANDPSIAGNGMSSQDGFNLTRDTDTGLEWLDVTISLDRTFEDVSSHLGAGGDYEGFRYATRLELEALFEHAGLILDDAGPEVSPAIHDFLSLFGSELAPIEAANTSAGRYDDTVDGVDPAFVGSGRVSDVLGGPPGMLAFVRVVPDNTGGPVGALGDPSVAFPNVGAWLVRPVPEPSSLILCCIGGGLLMSEVRRRRKTH